MFVCFRDGIPPYRYHKPHRREMHESARANGRVPLPIIPVSYSRFSPPSFLHLISLSVSFNCLSLLYLSLFTCTPGDGAYLPCVCAMGPVREYKNSGEGKAV